MKGRDENKKGIFLGPHIYIIFFPIFIPLADKRDAVGVEARKE